MTLQNLLAIHRLVKFEPTPQGVAQLLAAARRNLADARIVGVSGETRFDAACKAILQCAMTALWANGYRAPTSEPGHHLTAIQTLPKTIGVASERVMILDALRKQRNLSDYEGGPVSEAAVAECLIQAETLVEEVTAWLARNRPDLSP
jgi:hypothetical protein